MSKCRCYYSGLNRSRFLVINASAHSSYALFLMAAEKHLSFLHEIVHLATSLFTQTWHPDSTFLQLWIFGRLLINLQDALYRTDVGV